MTIQLHSVVAVRLLKRRTVAELAADAGLSPNVAMKSLRTVCY